MKMRLLKFGGGMAAVGVVAAVGFVSWLTMSWPPTFEDTPTPEIEATDDPEVIARGEYLFHTAAHCTACHTPRENLEELEPGEYAVPAGGTEWEMGPLGTIRASNITPHDETGIGGWTDAELARAIRHSVKRDHSPALMMNFSGPVSDEDLTAIISYMRNIEPVDNETAPSEPGLLGHVLFRGGLKIFASPRPETLTAPAHVGPTEQPTVERGEYLARGPGACVGCHTEVDRSTGDIEGTPFAGGFPDPDPTDPDKEIVAPNITPGGILNEWSKESFVTRMKAGRTVKGSIMPWENYAGMTDEDLESIYLYLQSLEPSDNDPGPAHRERGWEPQ